MATATVILSGISAILAGCTGVPERDHEVAALEAGLRDMPGLTDVWVSYENKIGRPVHMDLNLEVPTATADQIRAIIDRVNLLKGEAFEDYSDQTTELRIADRPPVTVTRHVTLDANQIADDALRLRQISAGIDGDINWFRNDNNTINTINIDYSTAPITTILSAVRRYASDSGVTVSTLPGPDGAKEPIFEVEFPLTPAKEDTILHTLAGLPVKVLSATISKDQLTALHVTPTDASAANAEMEAVISATDAGPAHPLRLSWVANTSEFGVVDVGGCTYPAATDQSERDARRSPQTQTLERQLRAQYDDCPK